MDVPFIEGSKNAVERIAQDLTKVIREIGGGAHQGGDPSANPRLRTQSTAAPCRSMTKDVCRARDQEGHRGAGRHRTRKSVRGLCPGAWRSRRLMTDKKVRNVAEVRHAFGKFGGTGAEGSVAVMSEMRRAQLCARENEDASLKRRSTRCRRHRGVPEDGALPVTAPTVSLRSGGDGGGELAPDSRSSRCVPKRQQRSKANRQQCRNGLSGLRHGHVQQSPTTPIWRSA